MGYLSDHYATTKEIRQYLELVSRSRAEGLNKRSVTGVTDEVFIQQQVDYALDRFDRWLEQEKARTWSEGYLASVVDAQTAEQNGVGIIQQNPYLKKRKK